MLYPLIKMMAEKSRLTGGFFLLLICGVLINTDSSVAQTDAGHQTLAASADIREYQPGITTLPLSRTDKRYALASVQNSSGFIAAEAGKKLPEAPAQPDRGGYSLSPKFLTHKRYWLYVQVENHTAEARWRLHISNFGLKNLAVRIKPLQEAGQGNAVVREFDTSARGSTDINTIGRALPLTLEPGVRYQLVMEMSGEHYTWYPYIALISEPEYQRWASQMDLVYKLAIGIVLGMILLGLLCWLLMAERTFLWASVSSFLMLIYYLEHSSLPEVFWQSSYEKGAAFWVLISLTMLGHLMFAASFLRIGKASGWLYNIFLYTGVVTVFIQMIVYLVPLYYKILFDFINYILIWAVILGSGIYKVRTAGSYYYLYLLGWMPLVLSVFHVGYIVLSHHDSHTENGAFYQIINVLYILILHMLIHAVALILWIKSMREEKIRAEFLSQAKSQFMAHSSHDLHQPLHTMQLLLDSLQPHINTPKATQLLSALKKSCGQMNQSFSSIMDLTKLESGSIKAEFQPVHLSQIFTSLREEFQFQAMLKNIELRVLDCSLTVRSDPELLVRLLRNLLTNAVKYTESGKVVLGCRRRGELVDIQVADTGPGIPAEDQGAVFDIYQRSSGIKNKVAGAGIGLSIVKHLSLLLDHPVVFSSTEGKGCIFTVTMPRFHGNTPSVAGSQPDQTIRIALVMADQVLEEDICHKLQEWHYSFEIYPDLAALSEPCDLLICDSGLLNNSLPVEGTGLQTLCQVSACVYTADEEDINTGGIHWTRLNRPVQPVQLRALLNYSERTAREQVAQGCATSEPAVSAP